MVANATLVTPWRASGDETVNGPLGSHAAIDGESTPALTRRLHERQHEHPSPAGAVFAARPSAELEIAEPQAAATRPSYTSMPFRQGPVVHLLFCETRSTSMLQTSLDEFRVPVGGIHTRPNPIPPGDTDGATVPLSTRRAAGSWGAQLPETNPLARLTVTNLCANGTWARTFFTTKYEALARWHRHMSHVRGSARLTDTDLVLVVDTDLLVNSADALDASALAQRFNEARGQHSIVFQAEPLCWVVFGMVRSTFERDGCSPHVRASWGKVARTRDADWRCVSGHCSPIALKRGHVHVHMGICVGMYVMSMRIWACAGPRAQGRFLCGGAFMGHFGAVGRFVEEMFALRAANARTTGTSRLCYFEKGEKRLCDQCLASHLLLRGPPPDYAAQRAASHAAGDGWIGLDYREALFGTAYTIAHEHEAHPIRTVPCGNVSCSVSRRFDWQRSSTINADQRNAGLQRSQVQQQRCALRPGGPAFVHFNGPAKAVLTQQYEQRFSKLARRAAGGEALQTAFKQPSPKPRRVLQGGWS